MSPRLTPFLPTLCFSLFLAPPLGAWAAPQDAAALYQIDHVWPVQLTFTADQWKAIEPVGGDKGPGGPGWPGPGRGGPNMGNFLAPTFLTQGDQNQDGELSLAEFRSLGERWFEQWDAKHEGRLDKDALRTGLNSIFTPPNPGNGAKNGPRGPGMVAAEGKRNGMAGASGIDFPYVHADLNFDGETITDIAARYKGNNTYMASRRDLKRPLKLDLNKYVKGQKLATLSTINLHNNVNDPGAMNEALSYQLFRDAGVPASRTTYARVSLTVSGTYDHQYLGLYTMVENVDKNFISEHFGTKKGAILKPSTRELFNYLGDDWAKYNQIYDPKDKMSAEGAQRVISFAKLVTSADDTEFAAKLADYVDLDEFARFMAVLVWLPSTDSLLEMGQNFYVYLNPATNKFIFLPWDFDHSFGQFGMSGGDLEKLSIRKPWHGQNRFLERVFAVEAFRKLYLGYMDKFSQTIFQPERILAQVDELAKVIRPAIQDESAEKLARFDKTVAGESLTEAASGKDQDRDKDRPSGPPREANKPIKAFVPLRAKSVFAQLAGQKEETKSDSEQRRPFGFGPGNFLADGFEKVMDADKDGNISKEEFLAAFAKWAKDWDTDRNGSLSKEEIRTGLGQALPGPGGPPPTR